MTTRYPVSTPSNLVLSTDEISKLDQLETDKLETTSGTIRFPEAGMITSRAEVTDRPLQVLEGTLPTDLTGHVIFMGPAGSLDMQEQAGKPLYPSADGTSLFNGDGMVRRFDCRPEGIRYTSRILKTPCYYADAASRPGTRYADLKFFSSGLARFSFMLGFRDEINTACIPVKFAGDSHWRLLASWDAGRPYEIDPVSLKVVTPVGSNQEWREQKLPFKYGPFRLVTTATHHAYDDHTQELWTVNWGKSLLTMVSPLVIQIFRSLTRGNPFLEFLGKIAFWLMMQVLQFVSLILHVFGFGGEDFVRLMRWDGEGELKAWKVVLPTGLPVQIEQSMHQVAVTRDHIVLMDTSFKLGPEQLIPNPLPGNTQTERVIREVLNYAQFPDTNVYIVRRSDLDPSKDKVVAHQVKIKREIAHFRVDYDDSNGIVLHVAHNNAWDPSEWPQAYDNFVPSPPNPAHVDDRIDRLVGMTVTTTDLNYLGRYTINPKNWKITEEKRVSDPTCTWAPALYADNGTLTAPERYQTIYWNAWGCWDELMTEFIANLYKKYKYRQLPLQEVLQYASKGQPASLCRLDTQSMAIVDKYAFPAGYFGNSPQFVPRDANSQDPTDGYLICGVIFDGAEGQLNSQLWVFDAKNLAQGPVCKLGDSEGKSLFGLTIHTTWIPEIAPRTASYSIPVRSDYDPLLQDQPEIVRELFEQEVYPHFEA
ncbi:carotenoid oxygenase family protein [Alkalinema pantanalense CENA528]|uniref:carotenoid oxygenase family protein n=1 Tax=Alkalinema pantanalense TaxID=1620705 RepID=UPI003D6E6390